MAEMHPSSIEDYKHTPTEKDLFLALQEQLPSKFHVFFSVRWFDKDEEDKRVDSECDFLVFDPSFGFLTIEVKGGDGIDIINGKWTLLEEDRTLRTLKCSPYYQSEKSMRHFKDYFENEFNQSFNGAYGFAVAFPRYSIDYSISQEAVPDLTIDVKDMNNLATRINEIFHYWKSTRKNNIPFSADQRNKFINAINKQISISAAAGALIPVKQKQFEKISFVQNSIIDFLSNYKQVQIVGGAGTGKTFIGMKKAIRDSLLHKNVLFVSCNPELINFVKSELSSYSMIDVVCYKKLVSRLFGNADKSLYLDLAEELPISKKYDSIIVDEAQDFNTEMGLAIRSLLKSETDSELYVFLDKNQNIFDLSLDDVFAISSPPYVLNYNIRNTGNIYKYAVDETGLGKETIANTIDGVKPEYQQYSKPSQTLKVLSKTVNQLVKEQYVDVNSIVIVSDVTFENSILANESKVGLFDISFSSEKRCPKDTIRFRTVEEFKGLESNIVIFLKHHYTDIPELTTDMCKNYVALTRARYYLFVFETKCKIRIGE